MTNAGKLVLGTVQFGCQYGINSAGRPDSEMVAAILGDAASGGITTLDTSSGYGDAEQVLGGTGRTGGFRIVSKYLRSNGADVRSQFSQSLKNLGVGRLSGYLVHHFDDWTADPALWDAFRDLRAEGLAERVGFSLYSPEELEVLLDRGVDFDILQFPRNIFDHRFDSYLPELKARGVEIHVRSTFLQGLFFKDRDSLPEKLEPLRKYLVELDGIAAATGLSLAELALNHNIQNPMIDGVLIGVDNAAQLRTNLDSLREERVDIDVDVAEQELLNPVNWK